MFSKTELTEKLTAELRELAKANGVDNAGDLRKNDLIEQILQKQTATAEVAAATKPAAEKATSTEKPARKRTRIAKDAAPVAEVKKEEKAPEPTLFDNSEEIEIPSPDFEAIALVTGQDLSKQESIADKLKNQKPKKNPFLK